MRERRDGEEEEPVASAAALPSLCAAPQCEHLEVQDVDAERPRACRRTRLVTALLKRSKALSKALTAPEDQAPVVAYAFLSA